MKPHRRFPVALLFMAPADLISLAPMWWASFGALTCVGEQLRIKPGQVFALGVDSTTFASLVAVVVLVDRGRRRFAWFAVGLGGLVSIAGNVAHTGGLSDPWRMAGGAVPALFLAVSAELTIMVSRDVREQGRPDTSTDLALETDIPDPHLAIS